jgi:hypothetical protein
MSMNDLTQCVIEWLDELVEYALERQPSVALAHARFAKFVETAQIHVEQNGVVANCLTDNAVLARKQTRHNRAAILAKIQRGDTHAAKLAVKLFFRELEKATILEQQAAAMRKKNRKMVFLLAHLQAVERRLYYLSVFLAPLPAFVASEQDDHTMLLRSIWEFVSGEISTESDSRTANLVERFEALESNALKEYAHIDGRHAARMRSSERHKLEKRIKTQLPLLKAELAEQTEKHFELLAKEKLHAEQGNRFESRLFSVHRQHCEKQSLRLEVYQLILEKAYESLQPSAIHHRK